MSMDTVHFEPKIATDLKVDWRRQNAGASADMFGDLLADQMKRRAESDLQELKARQSDVSGPWRSAEPASGRPARVTITHPKTLRGEAKEVKDTADRRLPGGSAGEPDCSSDESCAKAPADSAPPTDSTAKETDATPDATAETETTVSGDQSTQAGDSALPTAEPAATLVVAVQPADQQPADSKPETAAADLALPLPVPADGEAIPTLPKQAADAQDNAASEDTATADGGQEQPATEAAAAADMSAALAILDGGDAAPADATSAPGATPQFPTAPATAAASKQPLPMMSEAQAPITEPTPPVPVQAARPTTETKVRPATPTRAGANVPDPSPRAANAPQPVPPHAAATVQPVAASEPGSSSETFDQSLSPDSGGPGWALHLAQGAAGKRADFVAQLRQHLQNLPAHEQVAIHIQRALREGTGKLSIELSPAELGRIQVKLEIDEDKRVTAAVTVERSSTLELLQRDVKGLERALHDAGLNTEGGDLSFSLGQGTDQDFAQDMNQSAARVAGGAVTDIQPEGEELDSRAAEVMDTAAGMVNLQV
jgi:flagellar hook-length control protein FliK